MIRMKHPLHGFHLANGQEEVEMRKNGWVEDAPAPPAPEAMPTTATPQAEDSTQEDTPEEPTDKHAEKGSYNRKVKK